MFNIDKDIPMPNGDGRGREKGELRLTMEKMEVGDSVVVTDKHRQSIHAIAKALNIGYTSRKISVNQTRVWRTK